MPRPKPDADPFGAPLTPREADVLHALIRHGSSKGCARELGISFRTVDVHRANIMRKRGTLWAAAYEAGQKTTAHAS